MKYYRVTFRNVELSKNLAISKSWRPCVESNSKSIDNVAYSWIAEKIKCNLPWSNIKIGR